MDEDGYICLTDFGISKILQDGELATTHVGSKDYTAPEILERAGHSFPVDWWTLGILTYDMIIGAPPFSSFRNKKEILAAITEGKIWFPTEES